MEIRKESDEESYKELVIQKKENERSSGNRKKKVRQETRIIYG